MPREHFTAFAKQLIPSMAFRSTDKVFAELTGPQREAFVFYMWQEAGKTVDRALPHVGVSGLEVAKLAVVGAVRSGGMEVVVLSMPPTEQPNEAQFIALARGAAGVVVFFLERCAGDDGEVHPGEAVLAELRSDQMRINHGRAPGLDLETFKRRVGEVLEVSLDGLERSLPEFDPAAFVAAGRGRAGAAPIAAAGTGGKDTVGAGLAMLLAVRAGVPLLLFVMAKLGLPSFGLYTVTRIGFPLLSLAIGVLLIVWVYQVHARRRGQAMFSPGWSIAGWFIPIANLILVPLSVGSAWNATVGAGGIAIAFAWWVFWILETAITTAINGGLYLSHAGESVSSLTTYGVTIPMPAGVGELLMTLLGFGSLISAAAYGLLWYIVKRATARL